MMKQICSSSVNEWDKAVYSLTIYSTYMLNYVLRETDLEEEEKHGFRAWNIMNVHYMHNNTLIVENENDLQVFLMKD